MSAAPSTTRRPSATSTRASLPTVVVLPVPLTPTTSSTDGWSSCGRARIERSMPGCSSAISTSRSTARASASVRTSLLASRLRSCDITDSVTTGPRSAISRVSSTSCQESSSRSPPPIRPSRLRPSAFCDLASRPRSRSSRPSVGAMASISGAAGVSGARGASGGAGADGPRARPDVLRGRSGGRWCEGLRFRQLDVGDRAPRRVARNGRVVADRGQAGGVDPFGRRRGLAERDARRRGVAARAVEAPGSGRADRLICRRR